MAQQTIQPVVPRSRALLPFKSALALSAAFIAIVAVSIIAYRSLAARTEAARWVQGRSLTTDQVHQLEKLARSIIIKGARSPERLLDEVTLFLHQIESELPPERQRMLRDARDRESVFEGRRILIVEDDVRNVFALTSVLEPKGAVVEIARNGREALEHLAAKPGVDLVLMDIMMPEMDGLEATRRIRLQPHLAKLPIIALTAKAMIDDRDKCIEAGANDYITKPLDVDKLLSLARVWIRK